MFKKLIQFLSSCLLRLLWRHSQILRDLRWISNCADFCRRIDSSKWRTRTLQQSAGDCRLLRNGTPKSGNAFCNWLDRAARFSFVSFGLFFKILTFSGKFRSTALSDNGAMMLLGGWDYGSDSPQTGIWEVKESEWSRIGELSKV